MENYDELYHHGVKGMKWGVRKDRQSSFSKKAKKKIKAAKIKFQNEFGSRNTSALKRYRKKDVNRMSNKDIRKAVERMNLERQFRSLTKRDLSFGNKVAKDILAYGGTALLAYNTYGELKRKGLIPKLGKK